MLTLFPGERKPSISFTQRRNPSVGVRQTSIASFFTLQPGMTDGGNQRSASSHIQSQINIESKTDTAQPDHLIQGLGDDCTTPPLATSTPADIQETALSPLSLQTSGRHSLGTPFLTLLPLSQPDTLISAGENDASLAFSFTQDLESSLLDPKEGKRDSSRKRKWLRGSKNYQNMERHIKVPGDKCHQPLDKAKLERKMSAKENRQASVCLQTSGESWSGENTESGKGSPCPISVFSWESEKNDKDSLSQLFTEDSQGQRVIAHNSRAPFQDVTKVWNRGLGQFPRSSQAQCQDGTTQLSLESDLLFIQDSEGNQVIRHQS
ncbi:Aurora kinase A and ninein-interacting protein [Sciurus carolinensis]|uniref:Aurora kinase A and ninein-interacting protein n=1 Tax=Sciurus carolinensis TaxID=30640 RepID=A0AA41N1M3_SCICA|nr:Aurora kinase A and ninein-interacting protein [Sciurus carolinensis]